MYALPGLGEPVCLPILGDAVGVTLGDRILGVPVCRATLGDVTGVPVGLKTLGEPIGLPGLTNSGLSNLGDPVGLPTLSCFLRWLKS